MPSRILPAALIALGFGAPASAQVPALLGYQGRLLRADGTAASGTASVTFALFDASTGGTALWSESQTLGLSDGYYATFLGLVAAPPAGIFDGARWLELRVGSETLSPRMQLGSVPFALTARGVRGGTASVTTLDVSGQTVIDASGRLAGSARYVAGAGIRIDEAQTVSMERCAAGQALAHDGTTWQCATAGTVTAVGAAAPLAVTGGAATPQLSMAQAGAASAGFLSSADWSAFNAKFGAATACGGDLSGFLAAPVVARLQSRPVSAGAPSAGQVLKWTGAQWEPDEDADSGGTVTGFVGHAPLTVWNGSTVPEISLAGASGSSDGYLSAVDWNRFEAKYGSDTVCGGDLAGSLGAPLVSRIQGVSVASTVPAAAQVLRFDGSRWAPASLAIGDVGGLSSGYLDLSGAQTIGGAKTFTAAPSFGTPLATGSGGTGTTSAAAHSVFAAPENADGAPSFRSLVAADLPSFDASKIASGTLAVGRVPALDSSTIASGTLAAERVPSLDASKIGSGTLGTARGGTGLSGYSAGDLFYASGPSTLSALGSAAAGNVLISAGTGAAPSWGKVAVSHLGVAGTADGSTFLRGDGAWGTAVTSVAAGTGLTGGTISTSGTLAVDVGTTAGKIVQLDPDGKVPTALLPAFGTLSTVTHDATLSGAGTGASPLGVADVFVRKDRVWTQTSTAVAAGGVASVAHNAGTNLVIAQAWIKSAADTAWSLVGAASNTPAEAGTGLDGAFLASSDQTLVGKEWNFTSFSIPAGRTVTVTGSTPLTIKSQGTVSIAGTLTLAGSAGANGTSCCALTTGGAGGGGGGGAGGTGASNATGGSSGSGSGGGGAGGMGNQGGAGGGGGHSAAGTQGQVGTTTSCTTQGSLGAAGAAYTSLDAGTLAGGSGGGGGGSGGYNDASAGAGGGGGGAVKIVAPVVDVPGTINADGGKGGNILYGPSGSAGAPGGGGSGGGVWIVSSSVNIAGSVTARGGAGGDPFTANCHPGVGGAGAAGRIRVDAGVVTATGTVSPTRFSGGAGLPASARAAHIFQPDANTVAVQNDGTGPVDVKIVVLVP